MSAEIRAQIAQVLDEDDEWRRADEIAVRLGVADSTVRENLRAMLDRGVVERTKIGNAHLWRRRVEFRA